MAAQPDRTQYSTLAVVPDASLAEQLPRIEPAAAQAINTFLDVRPRCSFCVNQHTFELSWQASLPLASAIVAEISCGARRIVIALDGLAAIDPLLVGAPFSSLPGPLRNLVFHHRFAAFLSALPPSIAASAELRSVRWEAAEQPSWTCALGFVLRRMPEGPETRGLLGTDAPATLLWLHEQLPAVKRVNDGVQSHLPAPLTIVLGLSTIEAAQLRSLECADVVWIENATFARKGLKVQLHTDRSDRAWQALLTQTALLITGSCEPGTSNESKIGGPSMSAEPATLEVAVVFDLGALQVPVAEIERMQPGKTFELPPEVAEATVNLRVAGKCVAQGTLVAIGKRLGVRIRQVSLKPPASA
jgi:type III secretion system YscQ/HrcQ family protein